MAPHKTLINSTGYTIDVTLIVRKGDQPTATAGTVEVQLPPGPEGDDAPSDASNVQTVHYGDAINIYLNGLDLSLRSEGQVQTHRRIVLQRGRPLDNALNMFDTIEFLFDGKQILFTSHNTDQPEPAWEFTPVEGA